MTQQMQRIHRAHGEEGMALMLALVFLALFGLLVAALLNWGFTAERSDSLVKGKRDARYANDGAIEGAIKRFQTISAGGGENPCPDANFFKYTVNGKTATVACNELFTGGTPNPPQAIVATSVDALTNDFIPTGGLTLPKTLKGLEETGADGTVAFTPYSHHGNNTATFGFLDADHVPVGSTYKEVNALVSHREASGPGDAPNQDQSITVVTGDTAGNLNVNCGTYEVVDAKNTGGPLWPSLPYQTIEVTYQSGHEGDSSFFCINTPARVANAKITYNAANTVCSGRAIQAATVSGSKNVTSAYGFVDTRDSSPAQSISGTGMQANTNVQSITDATHFVVTKTANATASYRTVTDGVTTNNSTTVTSATAAFTSADIGKPIAGPGIPFGATILQVVSATNVRISSAAIASATALTLTIGGVNLTIGTPCGSPIDTLDGVAICICLTSRAANGAASQPSIQAGSAGTIRYVVDACTTAGSTVITSATANFSSNPDATQSRLLTAGTLALNTHVASVTNATTAVMNLTAGATACSLVLTIGSQGDFYTDVGNRPPDYSNWGARETSRAVTDGTIQVNNPSGNPPQPSTITSATANFVAGDVGAPVSGTKVGAATKIIGVTSSTVAILSTGQAVCASNCGTITIGSGPDPACVNGATCTVGSNTPAHYSQTSFTGASCSGVCDKAGDKHSATFFGYSWPTTSPVQYVSLRVVHREPATRNNTTLQPSVRLTGTNTDGSTIDCTVDLNGVTPAGGSADPTTPSLANTAGATFVTYATVLPTVCAPTSAAAMSTIKAVYTVTCAGAAGLTCYQGANPRADLEAIVFDLNYQLGGESGSPAATFQSTVSGSTASASAQAMLNDDNSVQISNWQSSH